MTIVVALKKDNEVILGSDSIKTLDDRRLKGYEDKIITFANFSVGLAGTGPISECLELIKIPSKKEEDEEEPVDWNQATLNTTIDVLNFLTAVTDLLEERGGEETINDLFLLIATNDGKIYLTINSSEVSEIKDYWAIGSGQDYALGAMFALWDNYPLRVIAERALNIACEFSISCGGDLDIRVIKN